MEKPSKIKKAIGTVSSEFNPRAIFEDAAEPVVGKQARARFGILKEMFSDIAKIARSGRSENNETFQEHVSRLGVSEKELSEIQKKAVLNSRILLVWFVLFSIYSEYIIATQEAASARIAVIALFFANLAITAAALHRASQIKNREFVPFMKWLKQPERWFS